MRRPSRELLSFWTRDAFYGAGRNRVEVEVGPLWCLIVVPTVDIDPLGLAKARNVGIRFGSTLPDFGYRFRVAPNANIAAIRRETGTALPISVLFESPTIRALASRLEAEGLGTQAEAFLALCQGVSGGGPGGGH